MQNVTKVSPLLSCIQFGKGEGAWKGEEEKTEGRSRKVYFPPRLESHGEIPMFETGGGGANAFCFS